MQKQIGCFVLLLADDSRKAIEMDRGLYKIPNGLISIRNLFSASRVPMFSAKQEPIISSCWAWLMGVNPDGISTGVFRFIIK
jgi:hypothetical protein